MSTQSSIHKIEIDTTGMAEHTPMVWCSIHGELSHGSMCASCEAARLAARVWDWEAQLKPGTCGKAMLLQAQASAFRTDVDLYNLATTEIGIAKDLAARLYVAEKRVQWLEHGINEFRHGNLKPDLLPPSSAEVPDVRS